MPDLTIAVPKISETIFSHSRWQKELKRLREHYAQAQPFPHIVLDHFLELEAAERALSEFPPLDSDDWIHYVHINEKKFGKTNRATFSKMLGDIIDELNSDRFVHFLSELTGIDGLFSDESLEGGGLHQLGPGGFLNIHADFAFHPHHPDWHRRVNVLIYLNKNWRSSYGGHLELWDRNMKRKIRKILPLFNRCVIFSTDEHAYHGHPKPLACPDGMTRKSIALYYFTRHSKPRKLKSRSTQYKARPGEGLKSMLIYIDKTILHVYDTVKRRFGITDAFASNVLKFLHELNKKLRTPKKSNAKNS